MTNPRKSEQELFEQFYGDGPGPRITADVDRRNALRLWTAARSPLLERLRVAEEALKLSPMQMVERKICSECEGRGHNRWGKHCANCGDYGYIRPKEQLGSLFHKALVEIENMKGASENPDYTASIIADMRAQLGIRPHEVIGGRHD
jgi:DnaJ-class molecular chaperone